MLNLITIGVQDFLPVAELFAVTKFIEPIDQVPDGLASEAEIV